jgi:hypothetical protein
MIAIRNRKNEVQHFFLHNYKFTETFIFPRNLEIWRFSRTFQNLPKCLEGRFHENLKQIHLFFEVVESVVRIATSIFFSFLPNGLIYFFPRKKVVDDIRPFFFLRSAICGIIAFTHTGKSKVAIDSENQGDRIGRNFAICQVIIHTT